MHRGRLHLRGDVAAQARPALDHPGRPPLAARHGRREQAQPGHVELPAAGRRRPGPRNAARPVGAAARGPRPMTVVRPAPLLLLAVLLAVTLAPYPESPASASCVGSSLV